MADNLKSELRELGIRQGWLAIKLGVDRSTITRWQTGDLPTPAYCRSYLDALWLLRRAGQPLPDV
jgi:hypothetical protein